MWLLRVCTALVTASSSLNYWKLAIPKPKLVVTTNVLTINIEKDSWSSGKKEERNKDRRSSGKTEEANVTDYRIARQLQNLLLKMAGPLPIHYPKSRNLQHTGPGFHKHWLPCKYWLCMWLLGACWTKLRPFWQNFCGLFNMHLVEPKYSQFHLVLSAPW